MNPKSPPHFPCLDRNLGLDSYSPFVSTRRNEFIGWISTTVLAAAGYFIISRTGSLPWVHILLFSFFLAASAAISLANWIDRKIVITVTEKELEYNSPLRQCKATWDSIEIIRILPFNRGLRVFVQAGSDHFTYRIQTSDPSVTKQHQAGSILGGDLLTSRILSYSGFTDPVWQDGYWEYTANTQDTSDQDMEGS